MNIFYEDLPQDFTVSGDIAIDTEAMGLSLNRDRLCLIQICDADGVVSLVQFNNNTYEAPVLKKILTDKNRVKIFHFARFDLAIIERYLAIRLDNVFCTKISSRLVRTYTDCHGLKDLCRELLSVNISKQQQSSYWGASILSKEQCEYAANDVIHLHALRTKLLEMLKREDRLYIAEELFKFLPIRSHLDVIGWDNFDIFAH